MKFRFINGLSDISPSDWDRLRPSDYPFLSSGFLGALETSGCVGGDSGWTPMHLVGESAGELQLVLPLYIKDHSYGEYVFDWQWARAYETHGRRYFPKLLSAIPFTPAAGPRVLAKQPLDDSTLNAMLDHIANFSAEKSLSSWHMLFPDSELQQIISGNNRMLERNDVQFHWKNDGYKEFNDFLAPFRSSKRKQIRRERRKVAEQGIILHRKTGPEITETDWQSFYACYKATYLKRSGHSGYLNWKFFQQIARALGDQVMIVFAQKQEQVIASSLFFFDSDTLYGRYWGTLADVDCLHFEACYYQGIDFAIEKELHRFDPGTQGEHKLVRGFEPTKTYSYHWIADLDFATAISNYLVEERSGVQGYKSATENYLPFRRNSRLPDS